jgi:hypothetical protein
MNVEELLASLTAGHEVSVKFGVRDEIGPDWIGGGRFFHFTDQGEGSVAGPALDQLVAWLISACSLPDEPPGGANINFSGDLLVRANALLFEGEWSFGLTYEYPLAYDEEEFMVADLSTMAPHAGRTWPWQQRSR